MGPSHPWRVVRDGWDPSSVPVIMGKENSLLRWSLRLGRWTATTVQKTTQKQDFFFFVPTLLLSILTHVTIFVCFIILFHSCCSHARVFGKHSCISSPFPIAILNDTCFFPTVQLVHIVYSERKIRNSYMH